MPRQVVVVRVQQVHGVEESDVPRGGGRRHVERRLLEGGRLVDGPCEGADTAGQEQKLVDLFILQIALRWAPTEMLQFLADTGVVLRLDGAQRDLALVGGPNLYLSLVLQQALIGSVKDERVEERVLRCS